MMNPKLIIHGGAWNIPQEYEQDHLNGIAKALKESFSLLNASGSALDAVELAVNIMEADPTYDAGKGAFLNNKGEIELDAIIVDGRTLDFGAVGGVSDIMHPVSLARKVMEHTEHKFLIGEGANEFAEKMGIKRSAVEELLTDRELEFYRLIKSDPHFKTRIPFDHPSDTVGAVAMDSFGNLAAATSTGGTPRKMRGRVGDSPIFGAGAYADNQFGAASTTGWGEGIMRSLLAFRVVSALEDNPIETAVEQTLKFMYSRMNGLGGIIGISRSGDFFYGYNTPKMAFGYISDNESYLHIK